MSSLWNITLAATGEFSLLHQLETDLPTLFHHVGEVDYVGGILIAQVRENYDGDVALEAAVARHPALIFNAVMVHQTAQEGSNYYVFTGVDGKMRQSVFVLGEQEVEVDPDEIDGRIETISRKIDCLTETRECYLRQREISDARPASSE